MFSGTTELLEKIQLGEDSYIELKAVYFAGGKVRGLRQNDLADEMAAFANSRGGVLVLGVDDVSRDILGIPTNKLEAVEKIVFQACEQSITPPLAPTIERLTLPDIAGAEQPVIRVDVSPSLFVHQSPSGYLRRLGSSRRPIPPEQLARLFQQRSQSRLIRFDETIVTDATLDDLDADLWQRFVPTGLRGNRASALAKLAMTDQNDDGVIKPTIAGLLMACRHPEQHLPGAFIQAVCYSGTRINPDNRKAYQQDAQDITGPLDKQIFATCDFVQKNMQTGARKKADGGREDLPQFDLLAVFEAVTNAVAHRDYSMAGSKIRLHQFADRLEIYTPGMLPNSMTPDSLPYRQASRNEAVTSLLARCPVVRDDLQSQRTHIMDKRGEGVPIILERSQTLSGKEAEYRLVDDSELLLTIYAANQSQGPA